MEINNSTWIPRPFTTFPLHVVRIISVLVSKRILLQDQRSLPSLEKLSTGGRPSAARIRAIGGRKGQVAWAGLGLVAAQSRQLLKAESDMQLRYTLHSSGESRLSRLAVFTAAE
jgi:hypothetical protein